MAGGYASSAARPSNVFGRYNPNADFMVIPHGARLVTAEELAALESRWEEARGKLAIIKYCKQKREEEKRDV